MMFDPRELARRRLGALAVGRKRSSVFLPSTANEINERNEERKRKGK
jgi:hypothetical protein